MAAQAASTLAAAIHRKRVGRIVSCQKIPHHRHGACSRRPQSRDRPWKFRGIAHAKRSAVYHVVEGDGIGGFMVDWRGSGHIGSSTGILDGNKIAAPTLEG